MRILFIWLIRLYQRWISPLLPPSCCYQPTCSQYVIDAMRTHGALRGGFLGLRRILRCHPWAKGGYDPVPGHRCDSDHDDHEHNVHQRSAVPPEAPHVASGVSFAGK